MSTFPFDQQVGAVYARAGNQAKALAILNDLEVSGEPLVSTELYGALGQKNKALAQLETNSENARFNSIVDCQSLPGQRETIYKGGEPLWSGEPNPPRWTATLSLWRKQKRNGMGQ
ncbi:MAG: hypothetical protein ACI9HY_000770 [Planctomycetaceae bacterium]|jgi:hypothetical protein